jgi:hypothetical protein
MLPTPARLLLLATAFPFFQTTANHVYQNPALHIAVRYTAALSPEDPANPDSYRYRARFALHPDSDPESKGADPCSPLLFAVGAGPDQSTDPKKTKNGRIVALEPTGGITLNEIKHACLKRDNPFDSDEKTLTALVENARNVVGLRPIAKTLTYQVQGATLYFAAASGPSLDEHDRRTPAAGMTYQGIAGALIDNRIFLFTFTANDQILFNRMLASRVCFDAPTCASGFATLVPYALTDNGLAQPIPQ